MKKKKRVIKCRIIQMFLQKRNCTNKKGDTHTHTNSQFGFGFRNLIVQKLT